MYQLMSYDEVLKLLRDAFEEAPLNEDNTYSTYPYGANRAALRDEGPIVGGNNISFNIHFVEKLLSFLGIIVVGMSKYIEDQVHKLIGNLTHYISPTLGCQTNLKVTGLIRKV
jgi:hypothetical protein